MNFKRERENDCKQTNSEKKVKQSSVMSFFCLKNANKMSVTTKFNKQAWVQGLNENQKELLKLEIESLHESWLNVLKDELTKPYFLQER
ncbi:hypothetical protein PORY_000079 [Pneumocystis oryctolagi]|uniref:Uncharacterized protein n=1 Tax=Pneumocystis oryctolagi TaxID=42067 RepID=A0ACB7CE82_9ASCO|nr:hypothetical protein PORY_000079 [Pneumocystis oryctolagi]